MSRLKPFNARPSILAGTLVRILVDSPWLVALNTATILMTHVAAGKAEFLFPEAGLAGIWILAGFVDVGIHGINPCWRTKLCDLRIGTGR
jgi:hypothetical protein